MKNVLIAIAILSALFLISNGCTQASLKTDKTESTAIDQESPIYVDNTTANPFDSVTGTTGSVKYWYVYFNADNTMEGFTVFESTKPGFSLNDAISAIKTKWTSIKADGYIGIIFFAEVNRQCYDEYNED
jgi:hypothetical protein